MVDHHAQVSKNKETEIGRDLACSINGTRSDFREDTYYIKSEKERMSTCFLKVSAMQRSEVGWWLERRVGGNCRTVIIQ
jgi:hypothetical protein